MSTQSRVVSAIEQVTTTAIGFVIAMLTQILIFPLFGLKVSLGEDFQIALIFTVVSLIRGYFVRRLFNNFHTRLERWFTT